jgi:DNA repair exonuclease SbcCD ATPase subunit
VADRDSETSAFSVGKGARVGNISVGGHVAGRDVLVSTTAADASSTQNTDQVLEVLKQVEQQIANLAEAPSGLRDDAQDEVRKAHQAGAQGDTQRLVEKLGSAQSYLERIGQSLPAAVGLAQTVATLALRITGQG